MNSIIKIVLLTLIFSSPLVASEPAIKKPRSAIADESFGPFYLLHNDMQNKLLSFLDIRSMARLEQCSKGMAAIINKNSGVQIEGHLINRQRIKQVQLPHEEGMPWPKAYHIRFIEIELHLLISKVQQLKKVGMQDNLLQEQYSQCRDLNEKLFQLTNGNDLSMNYKLGVLNESLGWQFSQENRRDIIEAMAAKNHPHALELKCIGLTEGKYGFENAQFNLELRTELAQIKRKLLDLRRVSFLGYHYSDSSYWMHAIHPDYKSSLEVQAAEGVPYAVYRKIITLYRGELGYERDRAQAIQLLREFSKKYAAYGVIEEMIQDDMDGITLEMDNLIDELLTTSHRHDKLFLFKWKGLNYGVFGYQIDTLKALMFGHRQVERMNEFAIKLSIEELERKNWHKFPRSYHEVRLFIDEWASKGSRVALKAKLEGLSTGIYGYGCYTDTEKQEQIVQLVRQGFQTEMTKIFLEMLHTTPEPIGIQVVAGFIEKHAALGNKTAKKRKLQGLYYGRFGFEQNQEAAYALARLWMLNIPAYNDPMD